MSQVFKCGAFIHVLLEEDEMVLQKDMLKGMLMYSMWNIVSNYSENVVQCQVVAGFIMVVTSLGM